MNQQDIKYYPLSVKEKVMSQYPSPMHSMVPGKTRQAFLHNNHGKTASVFINKKLQFSKARYALFMALDSLKGTTNNPKVLIPAYHCRSIPESVTATCFDILFYKLNKDLSIDLDNIRSLIRDNSDIKALLMVHYFGFQQPQLEAIIKECYENNVAIVEDCAHAFYGSYNNCRIGTIGDFVIASPWKFFPIDEGGYLITNQARDIFLTNRHSSIKHEIKSLLYQVDHLHKPATSQEVDAKTFNRCMSFYNDSLEDIMNGSSNLHEFIPADKINRGTIVNEFIIKHYPHNFNILQRRKNYQHWSSIITSLAGCHALHPEIDNHTVPYVFPVVVEKEACKVFHYLKCKGVPIWRWEDFSISDCGTSKDYRLKLFQLACHQDLTLEDIDTMATHLKHALIA